jgi:hypothetical protein
MTRMPYVPLAILALACLISFAAAAEPAATAPQPTGTWTGTSTCVGNHPACKDEVVVYRFMPIAGEPAKVRLLADKILEGKRVPMGALDFTVAGSRLSGEFQRNTTHGLWEFRIAGDTMEGTLVLLPSRELGRRVSVHRVSDDKVPAAPAIEDYGP